MGKTWKPLTRKLLSPQRGFWRYVVQIGKFAGGKDTLLVVTKEKLCHNGWIPMKNYYFNLKLGNWLFGTNGAIEKIKAEYDWGKK